MAIITRAEVKQILRISDQAVRKSVTLNDLLYSRLSDQPNRVSIRGDYTIHRVAAAADVGSTVTLYDTDEYYTTEDFDGSLMIRRTGDTGTPADGATVHVDFSVGEYDSDIDALIPWVEEDVTRFLRNHFHDPNVQYWVGDITFDDDAKTLTDDDGKFVSEGFVTGMDVHLDSSDDRASNVGIYNNVTVTSASVITVASTYDLVEFDDDWPYRISRINWPREIKPVVASIIWENLQQWRNVSVEDRSRGGQTVRYQSLKDGGYPPRIMGALGKFRRPVFV